MLNIKDNKENEALQTETPLKSESKLLQAEAAYETFVENSACTKRQRLDQDSYKIILVTPESKV